MHIAASFVRIFLISCAVAWLPACAADMIDAVWDDARAAARLPLDLSSREARLRSHEEVFEPLLRDAIARDVIGLSKIAAGEVLHRRWAFACSHSESNNTLHCFRTYVAGLRCFSQSTAVCRDPDLDPTYDLQISLRLHGDKVQALTTSVFRIFAGKRPLNQL